MQDFPEFTDAEEGMVGCLGLFIIIIAFAALIFAAYHIS